MPNYISLFLTGRLMHLYAICVDCLEGVHKIVCIKCKSRWDGSWHQLGTMYTYDILAASPCCQVKKKTNKQINIKTMDTMTVDMWEVSLVVMNQWWTIIPLCSSPQLNETFFYLSAHYLSFPACNFTVLVQPHCSHWPLSPHSEQLFSVKKKKKSYNKSAVSYLSSTKKKTEAELLTSWGK